MCKWESPWRSIHGTNGDFSNIVAFLNLESKHFYVHVTSQKCQIRTGKLQKIYVSSLYWFLFLFRISSVSLSRQNISELTQNTRWVRVLSIYFFCLRPPVDVEGSFHYEYEILYQVFRIRILGIWNGSRFKTAKKGTTRKREFGGFTFFTYSLEGWEILLVL